MKIKLKSKVELNHGEVLSNTKFYDAEFRSGFYTIRLPKNHTVILPKKYIKEVKE